MKPRHLAIVLAIAAGLYFTLAAFDTL